MMDMYAIYLAFCLSFFFGGGEGGIENLAMKNKSHIEYVPSPAR